MTDAKRQRNKRNKKRRKLRAKGLPENEVMKQVPIGGKSYASYASWLANRLDAKIAEGQARGF